MHQSPKAAAQAVTDLAQRIGASQLTEQHGDELRPAGKAFGGTLSSVLLYEYGELGSGKVMEQLIKQACDLYDWVALLWAAFGEFPARNGSPTSIIGGHSSYFRLQEPVLDKSDLEWEFKMLSLPALAPSSGLRLIFQPLLIQREALASYRLAQHARPVPTMPKLLT